MQRQLADTLTTAVTAAEESLRRLDAAAASAHVSAGRWSAMEILGHLIDSASNNHQRFVRAQYTDDLQFPKYEQNTWVDVQPYSDAEWPNLIDLWASYNRHLAHVIRNGENAPMSLQFLMEEYVAHLRHHLAQITERTAHR